MHDLLLLLSNRLRQTRNAWGRGRAQGNWRTRMLPLAALIWLGFLGYASYAGFAFLQTALGTAAAPVLLEAVASAFLGAMTLILLNGMRQNFDTFFISTDLPMLLSTPLSRRAIFLDRFVEGVFNNGVYAAMMILPPGVAFLLVYHAPWYAYLWLLTSLALLLAALTALSVLFDLLTIRLLPVTRAQQVLVGLNLLLILSVIVLYNAVSMRLVRPDQIVAALSGGVVSRQSYLPTFWLASSLAALVPGFSLPFWPSATLLLLAGAGLSVLAVWLSGWLYVRGWGAAHESPRRARRRARHIVAPVLRGGSPLRAFLLKDLRHFLRDSRSWSMFLFGLVLLIFFGVSFARENGEVGGWLAVVALLPGMAGLFTVRWMLFAFAQEVEAWWIIQAAPLSETELFDAKFLLNYILALAYNWGALLILLPFVRIPLLWLPVALGLMALLVVGTTSVGLAVAAWRTDPSQPTRLQRDLIGTYGLVGLVGAYVAPPAAALIAIGRSSGALNSLPLPLLGSLVMAAYLPVTIGVWAGMRAWAKRSLRLRRRPSSPLLPA